MQISQSSVIEVLVSSIMRVDESTCLTLFTRCRLYMMWPCGFGLWWYVGMSFISVDPALEVDNVRGCKTNIVMLLACDVTHADWVKNISMCGTFYIVTTQ